MKNLTTLFHSGKKYRFPSWLERAAMPLMAAATFLITQGVAHATAMDSFGTYLYGGFTGPLVKGLSTGVLVLGSFGLHKTEGRAHTTIGTAMAASGGILAAPLLTTEFQHAVGGVLLLSSQFTHFLH